MSAPVKRTCPQIDRAIQFVDGLTGEDISAQDAAIIKEHFEDLRYANSRLRNWGENCEEKIAELEKQVKDITMDRDNLQEEVDSLKATLEDLQKHIDNHTHLSP